MTGCKLEVAPTTGIVLEDMKVMVIGILKLIVVDCSSIILVVVNSTTVLTSVISADVLVTTEKNAFEFP